MGGGAVAGGGGPVSNASTFPIGGPVIPRQRRWTTALLVLSVVVAACKDATGPTTGTLELSVITTGEDVDDFLLAVDDGPPQTIRANGISRLTAGPGTHTLAISGVAFNCDLAAAPTSATITLGMTTRVEVQASCSRYLRNAIVYTSEQFGFAEVMVMRPDGSRRERLTSDQQVYAFPLISPDGQSIAVASRVGGSWNGIYLLDRFGQGRTKLVGRSTFDGSPAWSPDGSKLAFRSVLPSPVGAYGRIFVVNRDGSGLRQLTPETTGYTYDDGPSWSPDGTRLVFSRDGGLFVINADGTGLTSLGVNGMYPAWSPDGSQIAYHTFVNGILTIFVVGSNGAGARRLTTPADGDQMARWSPDGRQLVFQRAEGGVSHLYKIGADGSGETKLSTGTHHETWGSWSPIF